MIRELLSRCSVGLPGPTPVDVVQIKLGLVLPWLPTAAVLSYAFKILNPQKKKKKILNPLLLG